MYRTLGWEAACSIYISAIFGALISLLVIFGVPVRLGVITFFLFGFDLNFLYKIFLPLVVLYIVAFALVVHYVVEVAFVRGYLKLRNE
jgi:hypothetical protein